MTFDILTKRSLTQVCVGWETNKQRGCNPRHLALDMELLQAPTDSLAQPKYFDALCQQK